MVNKASLANGGTRVDFDSCQEAGYVRYYAGYEAELGVIEEVSNSVEANCVEPRVAKDYFEEAGLDGVFLANSFYEFKH